MALFPAIPAAALLLVFAFHHLKPAAPTPQWVMAEAGPQRVVSGRLAGQLSWRRCMPDDAASVVARARCDGVPEPGTREYRNLAEVAARVRNSFRSSSAPSAHHALALVDLQWLPAIPAGLDRAVISMETAHRATPRDADLLNDLGVAHLAVAERDQQLLPALRALEAVEQALVADSMHLSALFNRALILDRLYLVASARRAWSRYLSVEHDAGWRGEASARLRAGLGAMQPEPDTSLVRLLAARFDRRAIEDVVGLLPDRGRMLGFRVLAGWGEAVIQGDSARAEQLLALGGSLAAAQDTLSGDRSVSQAVSLAASPTLDVAQRRALAAAHAQLGAGVSLFHERRAAAAVVRLDSAEQGFRAVQSPAERWAGYFRAASYVNLRRYEEADSIFRGVLARSLAGEPSLSAKTFLALGLSQLRRGNYDPAIDLYRAAAPFAERAREPEIAGHVVYLVTEGHSVAGRTAESQEEAYRGLRMLFRLRRSNHLNNHLSRVAGIARGAGLNRAALGFSDELLEVARGLGAADVLALALCDRARDLNALGRRTEAEAALRAAEQWAARMPHDAQQNRIRSAVLLTRGELMRQHDPHRALALLAAAADSFRQIGADRNLPEVLFQAALAAQSAGEPARARGWMREAVLATERMQTAIERTGDRAAFAELVERVSDQMIAYELADGRADSAFTYLERARAAAWPSERAARPRPLTPGELVARLPPDLLLAEYALLGDRIAVWSVSRDGWRAHLVAVPRDSVRALVARLPADLSLPPGEALALEELHELLLRPLGPALARARRVVVVPDRELHAVPFAALRDRGAGRYAIESREFSTVPSAAFLFAALSRGAPRRNGGPALVIGNPALAPSSAARLGDLPGAAREAALVAELYPGATRLVGAEADRARIVELLPRMSLVHFAGHAVFDAQRPERSYLALTSRDGADGRLLAEEIERLRPSKLEVVVLSACSTINPRPSRAGGVAGLANSFLHAGARATVSTLWDVSDRDASELLASFHRGFRQGHTPSHALRAAQLRALHSASPAVRAPRTWAAFTYTGP